MERGDLNLAFSISATSRRLPRGTEKHGVDYYIILRQKMSSDVVSMPGDFVESMRRYIPDVSYTERCAVR